MALTQRQVEATHSFAEALVSLLRALQAPQPQAKTQSTPVQTGSEQHEDVRLLRVAEVANLCGLSRTKVYELMAGGKLPSVLIGGARRIRKSDVLAFIANLSGSNN